eukprot:TRINITY_DN2033_c4_g1_i1.p1 TRINITY_DN2033_c4_g1~~TRINITY_DN2033_c4_g1_i1.p1  ORF type:complete len:570 (+),score=102.96 TRINITY_DN2033_c4_g1_i1:26-1735(+)
MKKKRKGGKNFEKEEGEEKKTKSNQPISLLVLVTWYLLTKRTFCFFVLFLFLLFTSFFRSRRKGQSALVMQRVLSGAHDDESSDEEIRWGEETTAWDELLRIYREGAQKKTQQTAGTSSTHVTLDNLSQTTHGTQPGCQSRDVRDDDDSFLEFFPEWKEDPPKSTPHAVEEISLIKTPPRQVLKSKIRGRGNTSYLPTTTVAAPLDHIQEDEDDDDFFEKVKRKAKPHLQHQHPAQRVHKALGGAAEQIETDSPTQTPKKQQRNHEEVQERLKRQKIAEAQLVAFAADALERNPNSGRLSFQKKQAAAMPQLLRQPVHSPNADKRGIPESIEDAGSAPTRKLTENWLKAPAITSTEFRMGCRATSVPTPVFNMIMKRFKVVHAPIGRSGQLSAFLMQTTKMLTMRNNQLAKNNSTSYHMTVKVITSPPSEGRIMRVQVQKPIEESSVPNSGQSSIPPESCKFLYLCVTSHQIVTCTFNVGTTVCIHFPFHVRPMGAGRFVILGADLLTFPSEQLPAGSGHLNNPLSYLTNAPQQELKATSEWTVVENDEWELPPGTWEKVEAMLTPAEG